MQALSALDPCVTLPDASPLLRRPGFKVSSAATFAPIPVGGGREKDAAASNADVLIAAAAAAASQGRVAHARIAGAGEGGDLGLACVACSAAQLVIPAS